MADYKGQTPHLLAAGMLTEVAFMQISSVGKFSPLFYHRIRSFLWLSLLVMQGSGSSPGVKIHT